MQKKLQSLYSKIYDPKFNFKAVLPELTIDFFKLPIQPKEMEIIKERFTNTLTEARTEDELCPICYTEYCQGDLVTAIPGCGHEFHFDCIETWISNGNNSCPVCRAPIANL